MDLKTTSSSTYKNFKVIPKKKPMNTYDDGDKPMLAQSNYMKDFPDWRNGRNDVFHEKQPQYPFYSLPFKGGSNYQETYTEDQQRKLKEHNEMIRKIGERGKSAAAVIRLKQYVPHKFESQTTN